MSRIAKLIDPIEQAHETGLDSLRPSSTFSTLDGVSVDTSARASKSYMKISEMAEEIISIAGHPLRFDPDRKYLRWLYDARAEHAIASQNIIWIAGRQVEKTTTLVGKSVSLCILKPGFGVLAVEPRQDQTSMLSQQRFRPLCENSPIYDDWVRTSDLWQVGARQFANESTVNFKSCYYSADPARGVPAHMVILDEAQDIISDNIPILEQSMAHVPLHERYRLYVGTPKTTSNTLNRLWKETSQWEWLVPCGSKHWNYLDDKVIGKKGYICATCGKPIDMRDGAWHAMNPSRMDDMWGFRTSQLMVPFIEHRDVLQKMENPNIPRKVFFNEVLGLPYDEGELVLTEADILRACDASRAMSPARDLLQTRYFLCAGVDHGTGGYTPVGMGENVQRRGHMPSFTVVAFGAFVAPQKFRIFKIIRFVGEMSNLARQPEIINQVIREHGAKWTMSDYGFGAHTHARLVNDFDWSVTETPGKPLLLEAEYVSSRAAVDFNYQAFRYTLDRNTAIERTVAAIKRKEIEFFRQEDMKEFISDFTSIYVEYNMRTNHMRYDHTLPDDAFHAVVYCYHAALQHAGRLMQTDVPRI